MKERQWSEFGERGKPGQDIHLEAAIALLCEGVEKGCYPQTRALSSDWTSEMCSLPLGYTEDRCLTVSKEAEMHLGLSLSCPEKCYGEKSSEFLCMEEPR